MNENYCLPFPLEKVLSFDNENKIGFYFVLCLLIRTFAALNLCDSGKPVPEM